MWRIAVLPDTQTYAKRYPDRFEVQTRWIAENARDLDIRFVIHEGDVVHEPTEGQWEVAARALRTLDGRVPYVLAVGNHDYGARGDAETRETRLNELFPAAEMHAHPSFVAAFDAARIDNSLYRFETPSGAWLVLALEFGPRDSVVAWANRVLEQHSGIPTVVVTHAYLYSDGSRYDHTRRRDQKWSPHEYGVAASPEGLADGEALWQRLVRRHDQIMFVLCGHVLNEGVARSSSRQDGGGVVHELLANYQHRLYGGNGYLRLLEIDRGATCCHVRTYSPVRDRFKTDRANDFALRLE